MRAGADRVVRVDAPGVGSLELEEIRADPGSPIVGLSLAEACAPNHVLAIRHLDGTVTPNPRPDLRLEEGDLVILLSGDEALRASSSGRERGPSAPGTPPR